MLEPECHSLGLGLSQSVWPPDYPWHGSSAGPGAPCPAGDTFHSDLRDFAGGSLIGGAQREAAPEAVGCQAALAAFELKVVGQRNQSDGV